MNKFAIGCGGLLVIVLFIVFVIGLFFWGTYNRLVGLQQSVDAQWAQVQTVYQRRADLIPNLVNTVAGAANFEKSTLTDVTHAPASVGRVQLDPSKAPTDAKQLQEFQAAQGQLSNALSRLLVVAENYPQLPRPRISAACKRNSKEPKTGSRSSETNSTPRSRATTS